MRILWLKTELLHPVDKGGKIRTFHMLKELKKNHHVTYLTLDDGSAASDALDKASEYADETITIPHETAAKFSPKFYLELAQNLGSKLPYFMQKYVSAKMLKKVEEMAKIDDFDVVVCDFLIPAVNMPEKIEIPTVLFQHNVEAMIWQRHYQVQKNPFKKAYLKEQWKKAFEYERTVCRKFDMIVAVSEEDAQTMREGYGLKNVAVVPTGVDTEFFAPNKNVSKEQHNLVFTGSMDWLPNEDAIRWFTAEIYPLIKNKIPEVSLTVVGRNPFPSLAELAQKDSSIVVTGRVPDVRPFMDRASVYIVPIRIGGGTRLKIYEAMAMELPVVSTAVGAEGLPVKDNKEIVLRDAAQEFADAVINLMTDENLAKKIGLNAAQSVREEFSWQKVTQTFEKHCESAIRSHQTGQNKIKAEAVSM